MTTSRRPRRTDTGSRRPLPRLIGVVHLPPLPGSPRHSGGMGPVIRSALRDARALVDGGMDGVMVENFGDVPFPRGRAPAVTVAAMTRAAAEVRAAHPAVAIGINVLRNDVVSAIAIAAACDADFVRVNVLAGAAVTDQGVIEGDAFTVMRTRAEVGPGIRVLADVLVKHAAPLGETDPARSAADLAERALADGLIVTGAATGAAADPAIAAAVRRGAPDTPLWIGSGVSARTVSKLLGAADGVIVGTALKRGGRTTAPVDPRRVRAFVQAACR